MFVLGLLVWAELAVGEHERAIEHAHQILRLSPRDSRSYDTYHMLGVANFVGKQYSEGIRWALRAVNDKPEMFQPRFNLAKHVLRSRRHKRSRQNSSRVGWRGGLGLADSRIAKEQTRSFGSPPASKTRARLRRCDDG
jgi:hypothetical protein